VVIKAKGFKDKKLVVEGIKKKTVQFSLERIPVIRPPGPGSSHVPPPDPIPTPPPGLDCSGSIVNAKNRACVKQFCKLHPKDETCAILED